ncbi:aspartate aminotransferase family protein [Pseudoclavibacter chungangensis]|uniref:Aspartate aminotransferase family protein n=1 Tax=Pseudoclavibacter chungangensis TaxID=587635 RepID=A0A7J5C0Q6_9MICO|nr:aminotransferase class III-fold pyridoxal phosphate-dependent enzyme [Pseudoclavibacter chungangensis]KAB1662204.1 aspartate aminotransferase family protein [Pseudoclavibacter chungangensis]NYJ65400.1 adenosylmethionine-8-amino-7-oxononanoate aminotransferase [Pseudoclavibacter chungangensis]
MTSPLSTATAQPEILTGPALWPAQAHVPSVLGRQIVIDRGDGSFVTTVDGQRLYDGTAGLWHANVGHAHPALAQAAFEQMNRLEQYHVFARFANDKALALAERLADIAPIDDPKVIFGSGGSDAIDVACKLARRHWQREGRPEKTIIVSREHAYHGLHAFGTSIAGLPFNREGLGTESLVPETALVSADDPELLARQIAEIGPERIAAIVTEPIQGTGGMNPPAPGYLEAISTICRENDILLIVDEVITGFGRTGTMFASERYGLEPDLVTFAKGVTSGYLPLGGVFVHPRIWQPFYVDSPDTPVLRFGSTYAGHATAAAVALRHLDLLDEERLLPRVVELEALLRDELDTLAARRPGVAEVRVAGFLGGVQLVPEIANDRVTDALVDLGYITRPLRGNTLQISPPFVTSDDEVRAFVRAIDEVVASEEQR